MHPWEKCYPPGVRWDAPIAETSLGALADGAARFAGRPAIDYRGRVLAYAELCRRIDECCTAFLRSGTRGPLALYLPNTPFHPITFFGAAKAGIPIVHLSPLDAERELAFKLQDSGARTLVTCNMGPFAGMAAKLAAQGLLDQVIVGDEDEWAPGLATPLPQDGGHILSLASFLAAAAGGPPPQWPRVGPNDLALLQYTGGTTGRPKGAMLTHGNLTAAVSIYAYWSEATGLWHPGEERVIGVLPLFHIYALTTVLLLHVSAGNLIMLHERFNVERVLDDIEKKRATIFSGVPTMWIAIANHPGVEERDFSSLRTAASGAAPLPGEVADRLARLIGRRTGGGWGMTETSPAGTIVPRDCEKRSTIGLPLPGITLEVVALDDPKRVLQPGEVGELRVKGPNVTAGYWNRPDDNAAAFVDGYLLTGDVGRMDEDGYFYIVDRRKDMILSGGFNVYPTMIEEAIYEHPAVAETVVIGIPDPYRGEAAKAFVALKPGAEPFTLDALRDFLADKLGRHELPAALEFRQSLPRTPVGKLARRVLQLEEAAKTEARPAG
jgi:long-chain acyl-CoA synthetase